MELKPSVYNHDHRIYIDFELNIQMKRNNFFNIKVQ